MSKGFVVNPVFTGPLRNGFGYAIHRGRPVGSSVISLILGGCPSTVLLAVRPLVIHSLNTVLWRWLVPHILEKGLKGVQPLTAHGDPSPAVTRVIGAVRIGASVADRIPRLVLRRIVETMGSVRNLRAVRESLSVKASATGSLPIVQRSSLNVYGFSAVAPTTPAPSRSQMFPNADDRQPSKPHSFHKTMVPQILNWVNPKCYRLGLK